MTTPLKDRHRAIWTSGDYATVAADIIPSLGPLLVEACGIGPGQRVLDVAAGTGNAAIPAALTGADVTASDLTPALLETGERLADARGAKLTWAEADAEALPFADGEYDCVLSCVGVMFAPSHQVAADELVRVCRPGGTIGLLSWTPGGFIGQLFAVMKPFAPAPPPGAQPAPLWGDEAHVRTLLGDRVTDVTVRTQRLRVEAFAAADGFREYFKRNYGPTLAVYRALQDDPARTAELDAALDALAARFRAADGSMDWEYLLVTAARAGR
ncbi:class I SAM-dependent methyltransferase [Dactylosporangium vinaceum]|uniref:Class I SAM-dependent methyltransferase n=1 Tax=Dactylosporangium vinaceum TaxID=53362 RepID=A0ABV5MCF3_9ACTN|nr:class I SAM-dependent methyltransferase [Dactylosporangium vinaceum]UAB92157.1 class I SAM-dependent methyltransferase [Dactylosporangium vinaceum]